MGTDCKLIDAARRAARSLADRDTPFVHDCWYVAGFSTDFSDTLVARTILGRPLVLYRTSSGQPVALSDRCIHRSYPLSKSSLTGDTIVCGYHGLRFDAEGRCIEIPGQAGPCPKGLGVRAYPVRERGPLVWIWMGNGVPTAYLPSGEWMESPDWPASVQYHYLPASYISLHENLLDLTHLSYLHAATFGTPDFALAPYDFSLDQEAGHFKLVRTVSPTRLPPVWANPLQLVGVDAVRQTTSEFVSPAAHLVTGHFYPLSEAADPPDNRILTSHFATPETPTSTHYFIHHARNFAVHDEAVTTFMHEQLSAAFLEDIVGLSALEKLVACTPARVFRDIAALGPSGHGNAALALQAGTCGQRLSDASGKVAG